MELERTTTTATGGTALAKIGGFGKSLWRASSMSMSMSRRRRRVPSGHVALYAGMEDHTKKRFVVPVRYLNHPLLARLLLQAEHEFQFHYSDGAITVPCDPSVMADLLRLLKLAQPDLLLLQHCSSSVSSSSSSSSLDEY